MSKFTPLERMEFAEFGSLTAVELSPETLVVLELKPGQKWPNELVSRLREQVSDCFPNNRVMAMQSDKLALRAFDMPAAEPKPIWRPIDLVYGVASCVVFAGLLRRLVRRLLHA